MKRKLMITEGELRAMINSAVEIVMEQYKRELLTEMPFPRGEYKAKVDDRIPQVITNWCLVRYCTLTGRIATKNHWQNELITHIESIARLSIKGNNKKSARTKVLNEIWYDNDYNTYKAINFTIHGKFLDENINTNTHAYIVSINDFIRDAHNLFDVILSEDENRIEEYARNI